MIGFGAVVVILLNLYIRLDFATNVGSNMENPNLWGE